MKAVYKFFIGTSVLAALLGTLFFIFMQYAIRYHLLGDQITEIDPLESERAIIYGTFTISERIDGSRSGMTIHDITIKVDYVETTKFRKLYASNMIKKNLYKLLTWKNLKNNILDYNGKGGYSGLSQISSQFKSKYLNRKVKITGRIYALCFQTYYLSPSSENKTASAFPCWVSSQYHISLPGYYYDKKKKVI